ncbi:MAG: F0F1 ATP synthase subunit B [Ruminococcaceae bacterium]|nr:F0F1 ATP synthase subunit B [Oscillospiraceae bacterium]
MQTLDVISVNLWHILVSLLNLVILFFLFKKFLFKPVKKMVADREAAVNSKYEAAKEAETKAKENEEKWNETLKEAGVKADSIIKNATDIAKSRAEGIIRDADIKADGIVEAAKKEAELERLKATDGIKREIVDISAAIAEKMLEREVNTEDHRAMIDSFINNIDEKGNN